MTLSKNIVGAGLAGAGLFLAFAWVWPTYQSMAEVRTAIAARQTLLAERETALDHIDTLYEEYQKQGADIQKFSLIIPETKSTAELISAVEDMAFRSGVQISKLGLHDQKGESSGPYSILGFDISLDSTYASLFTFLGNVEKNIRVLDVTSIQAAPLGENSNVLSVTLKGTGYFLK